MVQVHDSVNTSHPPPLEASLDFESLLTALPTSPMGSEGYAPSETNSASNRLDSPSTSPSGSGYERGTAESPSHSPLVASTFSDPSQWSPGSGWSATQRNSGSDFSSRWSASPSNHLDTPTSTNEMSSDVRIDVGKF